MLLKDIIKKLEEFIPKQIGWEKDNTGLQIGNPGQDVSKILLCLELTKEVLKEARELNCELVITHHPFFFKPLNKIDFQSYQGSLIKNIIQSNVSLYSAHTNFDQYKKGISYALANKLDLQNRQPLENKNEFLYKIVTFVPAEYSEKVAEALASAGAGSLGNYSDCSFRTEGVGTFKGNDNSNPFLGQKGILEKANEIKIEMIFPIWRERDIVLALMNSHPYEEPAYDIIALKNSTKEFGYGMIGDLENEIDATQFITKIKDILNVPFVKASGNLEKKIKRVALLGGSGSNYITAAISQKADIFITADLSYHSFFNGSDDIILVDAGHYETEIFGLNELYNVFKKGINPNLNLIITKVITNPIKYL
jgi:dinuclear metal center YbgI/SA1388 family protein